MRITRLLVLLAALAGVGATAYFASTPDSVAAAPAAPVASTATAAAPAATPADPFSERTFGKADAPVTLVEYAALTCVHCAHFHTNVMPLLKQTYLDKGLVRIVFVDFPFNEIGLKAAMATRCAPEQNYYDFLQALFLAQDKWSNPSVGDTLLKQMAGFAGLSTEQYDACVKNSALSDHLLKLRVEATNSVQVSATPTVLVQGTLERVVGAQEFSEYAKVIDRQLARLGITPPAHPQTPAAPAAPAPDAHNHE